MVVTNSEKIYNYIKLARNYGVEKYNYQIQGINSRMDEIQAIFLVETIVHYPIVLNRMKVFEKMNKSFKIAEEISNTELSLPYSASH